MWSKRWIALLAALLLTPALALAQEEFEGNVVAGDTVAVTAPFGGTIRTVDLQEGSLLNVGDAVAIVDTTRVYAPVDGTVNGIFCQAGDALSGTTVLYLAPVSKYTLSCSIDKAYTSIDNRFVHIGEKVYIKCSADGTHKAEGIITAVSGAKYTVQTTAGELYMEETVYIYRSDAYTYATRIGSGTVGRTDALAVTGTGSLLALHVQDGDSVERGQLLFETVEGSLDALSTQGDTILSDTQGVVAAVNVAAGQTVSKGDVLLTVYPPQSEQIAFTIDEDLLGAIAVGDPVKIVFNWNEDSGTAAQGTVTAISYVSDSGDTSATASTSGQSTGGTSSSATQYLGYASFQADDTVRLGMSVTVTTLDE